MADLVPALADLVLPRHCPGCRRPGVVWCDACRPTGPPLRAVVAGVRVVAATGYVGGTRAALLAYKERGRRDLGRPLAGLLASAVAATASNRGAVLVPVPSSRRASRERGFDHLRRLVRHAARTGGLGVVDALRLSRTVHDSAALGAAERAVNLNGAMLARPPTGAGADGGRVIVVDDIATSGATLREAIRALREAGWVVDAAAVIAATMSRR